MATITNENRESVIIQAITQGVQKETEQAFENLKKELIEKLDREKSMIVSGIVLNVMKYVSMERVGPELVVTIREIKS